MSGPGPLDVNSSVLPTAYTSGNPESSVGSTPDGRTVTLPEDDDLPSVQTTDRTTKPGAPKTGLLSRKAAVATNLKSFQPNKPHVPLTGTGSGIPSTSSSLSAVQQLDELDEGEEVQLLQRQGDHARMNRPNLHRSDSGLPDSDFEDDEKDLMVRVPNPGMTRMQPPDDEGDELVVPPQPQTTGAAPFPVPPPPPVKTSGTSPTSQVAAPVVSVDSSEISPEDVKSAQPLNEQQQIQKSKFKAFFMGMYQLIKKNKNVAAMGGGAVLSIIAIGLLASPAAPAGAVLLAFGFTTFMVGFAQAMYNNADAPPGSPQPHPDPNEKPKNEEKKTSEGNEGEKPGSSTDTSSESSSAGKGGKFYKYDTPPPGAGLPLEDDPLKQTATKTASLPHGAAGISQQQAGEFASVYEHLRPSEGVETSWSKVQLTTKEAEKLDKDIAEAMADIAAEFAARKEMVMTPELGSHLANSMEVAMQTILTSPDMTAQQRSEAIQAHFDKLIDESGATYVDLAHLYQHVQTQRSKLVVPEAAKEAVDELFDSILARIQAKMNRMQPPPLDALKPDSASALALQAKMSATPSKPSSEQLEEMVGRNLTSLMGSPAMRHFWIFEDNMRARHSGMFEASGVKPSEFHKAREHVLTDAINVMEKDEPVRGHDFKTKLIDVVDKTRGPVEAAIARKSLEKSWFLSDEEKGISKSKKL